MPCDAACDRLLQAMHPDGFWEGRLSSRPCPRPRPSAPCRWPTRATTPRGSPPAWHGSGEHQNADGGWGDTTDSPSNLATTLLAVAALRLADAAGVQRSARRPARSGKGAMDILPPAAGGNSPRDRCRRSDAEYGDDRTFAVPILMNCGLAGLVSWSDIPGLPFELAVLPHGWYKALRLHVVSYALPALIAIGLLIDRRHPPRQLVAAAGFAGPSRRAC